ncbi:MAG: calcium-binding protein, partial [Alphaproteobacteria bacterium]
ITAEQLTHWMAQPNFGDLDCSLISPLESAATLGILKTFPIYKPFGRDLGWLEIEHLDTRFSGMNLPGARSPA